MQTVFRHLALLAIVASGPALAQDFENLEQLETQVVASLGAGIGEPGGPSRPIDRRLRLSPCPEPATVEAPALGAVTVSCQSIGWRIRVPLTRGGPSASAAAAAPAARQEPVIRRGDQVQLVAMTRSFTVSTMGIAEEDGAPGERIRVRREMNAANGRGSTTTNRVIGEVLTDGRVALPGFN